MHRTNPANMHFYRWYTSIHFHFLSMLSITVDILSCRISDFSALVNRVFQSFVPGVKPCSPAKGKVTATQGEQQLQRQKRMESIHRVRDSQLFPPSAVFFFVAFWRISENPKQLPKCHDDSWSIDVSSWFSHGKIVEDLCRTWVEAKSYGNTRCFAQAAIKDVRTYSSAKFGHQHWPQSLLFPDVFVVSLRAPWHLFKMDDTWYLPWFA